MNFQRISKFFCFTRLKYYINNSSPKKSSERDSDEAEALDLQTFSEIADKITISNDEKIPGRVNVNTAPKVVLTALLGGDSGAAWVVKYQTDPVVVPALFFALACQ